MKNKLLLLIIGLIIIIPFSVKATTKQDILDYIDKQEVCDKETKKTLNQYKLQFSRMLKERELSEKELDIVYDNVKSSIEALKKQGVCKKSDFEKVPDAVINNVENQLVDAITTVVEAPSIYGDDDKNTISGVVIDRQNMTIEIISNNALADKVELSAKKFNYVGANKIVVLTTWVSVAVFLLVTIGIILLKKLDKGKALINPLLAIDIVSFIIAILFIGLAKPINKGLGYLAMMQRPTTLVSKKIVVDENHEIMQYPNYYDEYAEIKIASVDIDEKVAFGDGKDVLAGDIGHSTASYMPGEGNTIIYSGHNYKLANLKNIKKNDSIVIETSYGTFTYKVNETKIMNDTEYDDIEMDTGKENLVLYTCYPFSSLVYGNKRFVVFASLQEESWN